eukprot:COSAG02_NODE_3150_length_7280_cov_8.158892_5_plen_41_part_00
MCLDASITGYKALMHHATKGMKCTNATLLQSQKANCTPEL